MSYYHSEEYAHIEFDRPVPEEELRSMLAELAAGVIQQYELTGTFPDHAEDALQSFANGEHNQQAAIQEIADAAQQYIDCLEYDGDRTKIKIYAEYQSEHCWDSEFAEEVAKHLFSKTSMSHFTWHFSSFSEYGGEGSESIGFRQGNQVVLLGIEEYLQRQLALSA